AGSTDLFMIVWEADDASGEMIDTEFEIFGQFFANDGASGVSDLALPGTGPVLDQNHPNPFNPSTTIHFRLLADEVVRLEVYGIRGQRVRTLVSGRRGAGLHSVVWDGTDDAGTRVASGIYFYQLTVGSERLGRKMSILK
ncbi:MAG: FlgD immunoglobulin-like domain containing protein, partial [Candidatus Eisenbacteria bacterium]